MVSERSESSPNSYSQPFGYQAMKPAGFSQAKREKPTVRRRRHKNSKLGCPNCKRRRVKCSEDLPSCANCVKHKVKCGYLSYTPEQIEELQQAKLQQLEDMVIDVPPKVFPTINKEEVNKTTSFSELYQQSIVQDYDNLLTTNQNQIIYPVYSISQDNQQGYPNPAAVAANFSSSSSRNSSQPPLQQPKELPGAIVVHTSFRIRYSDNMNNQMEMLDQSIGELRTKSLNGTATFQTIRILYYRWMNSFIFRARSSPLMFGCLINLGTNYIVSNLMNNSSFRSTDDITRFKNHLIVISIKHYTTAIKELRYNLNKYAKPEVCSSASYLLLLMSAYDPEATLNSTLCFRDGLFSILTYNLEFSKRKNEPLPEMIPVHLQLMKNIARSVYMPGYHPAFLREYQSVLRSYGALLKPMVASLADDTSENATNLRMSESNFDHLASFLNGTINKYVPLINQNLGDLQLQKECLFDMVYTWIRLAPSRLSIISHTMHPTQKILLLFYKLMSKALFAVFPQVKFFFLRDFDSPLMVDVNHEKDQVLRVIQADPVIQGDEKLRKICNYCIRVSYYLQTRLALLYRVIVHDKRFKEFLDIDDVPSWTRSIVDIEEARKAFSDHTQLREQHIKTFLLSKIESKHYPQVGSPDNSLVRTTSVGSVGSDVQEEVYYDDDSDVDEDLEYILNTGELMSTGFYESDFHVQ